MKRGNAWMKRRSAWTRRVIALLVAAAFLLAVRSESSTPSKQELAPYSQGGINLPFSLRQSMSSAFQKQDIVQRFGEPEVSARGEAYSYEIRRLAAGGRLVVIYEPRTNRVVDMWRLDALMPKAAFSELEPNTATAMDVWKIDEYTNLLPYSETQAMSEHQLEQGRVKVLYTLQQGNWVVTSLDFIETRLDLSAVLERGHLEMFFPKER